MSRSRRAKSRRKHRSIRHARRPLWLEQLESRQLLAVTIPGNFDFFVTDPGSTNIDIGTDPGGDNPPLPAGFFGSKAGTPSDPFMQADILLEGNPPVMNFEQFPQPMVIGWVDPHGNTVGPDSIHKVNQVLVPDNTPYDTVVRRLDDATFNGTSETQNVDIEIVALSLKSVEPIVVTYGAESPVLWDVFVTLDETATQPTGSIDLFSTTFTGSAVSGDVNNFDLPVAYKVIFREAGFPANEIIVPSGTGMGELPPAQFTNPNPGTFSFPAGLVAEKTDILAVDGDGDNKADPGDTLQYQVGIANHTGSDLTNVQFSDPLSDPNLSLVGGSIQITPIAFDDNYNAITGSTLTVSAAASGILGNDVDPDGVSGAAGLDVTAAPVRDDAASTAPAGTLNVTLADGTFTYTPNAGATAGQVEVFTYNIVDAQTLNALVTGVITFNITAPPAPVAMDDSYDSIGNVGINVPAASGVLFNDTPNGGTITAFDATSANGGAVSLNTGDGSFTYTPAPGYEGMDTFTYTLTNGGGSDIGTVTVTVSGMIWFINNAAGGANVGTLQNPFASLAAFNTANAMSGGADPDVNDNIFVYESATQYTGAVTLRTGQKLIGQDATASLATVAGITVPTFSNALPAMNSGNGTISNIGSTVTLNTNTTVRGLSINSTTSTGVADPAAAITGVSVSEVSVATTTGRAVNLSNVDTSTLSFRSISSNGAANGISLSTVNTTSGSFTVTGDGSTATQGGNDTGGVIQNTTGDGVALNNTKNVTLQNMTIGDTTASAADSGDAINKIGDDGIDATNVTGLMLKNVTIARTATHGVRGTNVTNFTMDDSQNFNAGDADGENGIYFSELRGDNFIRRSLFDAFNETGVEVVNASGTVDITFDDTTFQDNINTVGNAGEEAILLVANGTAEIIALVTGNADTNLTKSIFDDIALEAIQALSLGGGTSPRSSIHLTVENSRFLETGTGDGTIIFNPDFAGDGNITVKNNFFTDDTFGAFAVLLKNDSSGTLDATIQGNTATNLQLLDVNHDNIGSGGAANGTTRLLIGGTNAGEGNTNTVGSDGSGISLLTTDSGVDADVDLHATVLNNTVTLLGGFGFTSGIYVDVQNTSTARINIQGNTSNGASLGFGLHLKTADSSVTGIEGLTGGAQAYLEGNNTFTNGAYIQQLDSSTIIAGNADLPAATTRPNPLMAAPAESSDQSSVISDQSAESSDQSSVISDQDSVVTDDGVLTTAELDPIVAAAKARWTATGLDAAQQAALDAVTVSVTDMPGWYLAQATGPRIAVDTDAAGYGWFIDATPFDDSEFDMEARSASEGSSLARQASIQMDLLTTVLHEMGHVLGLDHSTAAGDVMSASLTPGVRRVPTAGQADGAVPLSVNSTEYMVGPVNLGTLPAGKAVQINYRALISATAMAMTVSNQGTVTADGPISQVTDDPSTTTANDPTVTPLDSQAPLFAKAFAPDVIGSGGISTLTFTIDNTAGSSAATGLDFTDNMPGAITIASPANATTTCTGGTLTATSGMSVITYTGGSVAAASSCTVQVDVTSSTVGTHVNTTGDLTSSLGNSGTANDSLVVEPPPTFAKVFSPDPILSGGTSTLTFTIDNSASALAASGLDFTDSLPAGVVIATPPAASTTCTGGTLTAAAGTSMISYSGGTVAASASCTVQVDVTSSVPGAHVNVTGALTSSNGSSGTATDTLNVIGFDFGDAPDAPGGLATGNPYPTLLEHNGARHALVDPYLGASIDMEADGQPNGTATGDDTDGNDDEDGVTFTSALVPGTMATLDITTSGAGKLNAWIDFNDNGSWADPGEQIFTDFSLGAGANNGLTFSVPFVAPTAQTFARFRFNQDGGLSYDGPASDGEVEDYEVAVSACSTTVTSTSDNGAVGTLRYAIQCANATPGVDTIDFNINAAGVQTIAPMSNLPAITEQATVDATTQMGYGGTPLIKIDGAPNLGLGGIGLEVAANADGSIIRGFNIVGMFDKAIFISRADNTQVESNFIGTDPTGTAADPNGNNIGVYIVNGTGNTVGGTTAAQRNVISGNFVGVTITGGNAANNTVSGNFIGTDVTGTAGIGNTTIGVEASHASNNTIGGTTAAEANVISANIKGVEFRGANSGANKLQGNLIGTDATGTVALGNNFGVVIRNNSQGNTIGGDSTAGEGNVISGNNFDGVYINNANMNKVQGNAIGTDATGTSLTLGNIRDGVELAGTSQNNLIGGTSTALGNLLSGNGHYGVKITSDSNQVQGNRIGTDINGTTAIGNGRGGVLINSGTGNTIGGANAGGTPPGNQIAGNSAAGAGVMIQGTSQNNMVQGNRIGTDAAGTGPLPNLVGVRIRTGGMGNTIGGDATIGEGNVISGNAGDGIAIRDTDGTDIFGNLIGLAAGVPQPVCNGSDGIEIVNSQNIAVGGTGQGQGNVISGNTEAGVNIVSGGVTVQANRIGTDEAGNSAMPNDVGVLISGAGNTIGGDSTASEGNQISGNTEAGVQIQGATATGNAVRGNLIGTDSTGGSDVGNKYGLLIFDAPSNTVGGANTGDGNIISGNSLHGVYLKDSGATGNQVHGNQIGTNLAGTSPVANSGNGVLIENAPGNTIGGPAAGEENVISGNSLDGVKIQGAAATGNMVFGNLIGTDAAGTTAIANRNGVRITDGASNNIVGDGTQDGGNTIADNNDRGVWINSGTGNTVRRNSIHDNGGAARLGIDLGPNGATANDLPDDVDTGANNLQNFPVIDSVVLNGGNLDIQFSVPSIAPNSTFPLTIEFFIADADNQEGETFLPTAQAYAGGTSNISIPANGAQVNDMIVATATDDDGNTSEFSLPAPVMPPLPLLAAAGPASDGAPISADVLPSIVDAAVGRLAAVGLDASLLASIDVSIADLPGAALGLASSRSITIDANAAGHGWFIDATPLDDSEFESGSGLSTLDSRPRIDLLTVVMHELGHAAGLEDLHDPAFEDDLMFATLEAGVRKTSLEGSLADAAFGDF